MLLPGCVWPRVQLGVQQVPVHVVGQWVHPGEMLRVTLSVVTLSVVTALLATAPQQICLRSSAVLCLARALYTRLAALCSLGCSGVVLSSWGEELWQMFSSAVVPTGFTSV